MYVIKVGEYYVKKSTVEGLDVCLVLSKELMRGFTKETAEKYAKKLNGEVIEITDEVTNDD